MANQLKSSSSAPAQPQGEISGASAPSASAHEEALRIALGQSMEQVAQLMSGVIDDKAIARLYQTISALDPSLQPRYRSADALPQLLLGRGIPISERGAF